MGVFNNAKRIYGIDYSYKFRQEQQQFFQVVRETGRKAQ